MSLVFYILLPFAAFIYSCTNLKSRANQIVFILFFGLFGYCHTFEDTRSDSFRKHESFNNYAAKEYDEIYRDFKSGDTKDVYEDLLFSTVKSFTDDSHIMMMIVGLIGGFFYMLVVKRFLQDRVMSYTWPIAILLAFMVMESNIPLMGGIRNFTAFPLFMYSLIRVLIDNKKIWLIGLLLTPFIHFGYIIAVVAALFIWLVRVPNFALHYIAIAACALSLFLDTSSYNGALDLFMQGLDNESIEDRVANYGEADTDEHFNKSLTTQLLKINNQVGACFIILLLLYIRHNRSSLRLTEYDNKIYKILLFFIIVSFSLISFSVVGQRFVYIAMVLLYLYLLNVYQQNRDSAITWFIYLMPLAFIIHIAWTLFNCYYNVSIDILYYPLPLLLFF